MFLKLFLLQFFLLCYYSVKLTTLLKNSRTELAFTGTTSVTKDYWVQQHNLFRQPSQYNDQQQYRQNRNPQKYSSVNIYISKKPEHCGNIHSEIQTPVRKYFPIIPN